jgi:NADH:ubiquinone oxidoreductase subunit F (NADH-binding)
MRNTQKQLKTCSKGHRYYKTSDCPSCPICEAGRKPKAGFMKPLSAPARRALEREELNTLEKLARLTEGELLALHGIGPTAIPPLRSALAEKGLSFRS